MSTELEDFEQFMKRREEASQAYVQGDAEPLGHIVARTSPASFFGPNGGVTEGTETVAARYASDAEVFAPGSRFTFETVQIAASDGIAYWVGFMPGELRLKGKDEAIPMKLRVTEIFRRENGEWKMVHRHADPLAEPKR